MDKALALAEEQAGNEIQTLQDQKQNELDIIEAYKQSKITIEGLITQNIITETDLRVSQYDRIIKRLEKIKEL
jgi:hypothetical protein